MPVDYEVILRCKASDDRSMKPTWPQARDTGKYEIGCYDMVQEVKFDEDQSFIGQSNKIVRL
jgi:hypothetical protein